MNTDDARQVPIEQAAALLKLPIQQHGTERHGPCPQCGGSGPKSDRFWINLIKQNWYCRRCQKGGDVIELVRFAQRCGFKEAVEVLTGYRKTTPLMLAEKPKPRPRQNRTQALDLWNAGIPLTGDDPVSRYLMARGVEPPQDMAIRLHRKLPYWHKTKTGWRVLHEGPAMLALVEVNGRPVAVHRTWIEDGKKALISDPEAGVFLIEKKIKGPSQGGAVVIGGVSRHIAVCEGIETGLGVWHLKDREMPVYATLSTSGMVSFRVPDGVEAVSIYADGDHHTEHEGRIVDPPGSVAAKTAVERYRSQGVVETDIYTPPPGSDFLDVWNTVRHYEA